MSAKTTPTQGKVIEDAGATFLARVLDHDGQAALQSDIASIAYRVHDESNGGALVTSGSLTVSSVIFDALQTDARWTVDTTGYNFRHAMPAAAFPTGGHRYRIEYKFTPASGAVYFVLFEVVAEAIRTS